MIADERTQLSTESATNQAKPSSRVLKISMPRWENFFSSMFVQGVLFPCCREGVGSAANTAAATLGLSSFVSGGQKHG